MAVKQAKEPQHAKDDQHEDKRSTEPAPAVAVIAIVSATAAQQDDQQDNEKYGAHLVMLL
jgi:hypothetical protein